MKYIISLFIISFTFTSILAQIPGYLGKRFSIEGDLNLLPNMTNLVLDNSSRQAYFVKTFNVTNYDAASNTYYTYEAPKYYSVGNNLIKKNNIRLILKSSLALNYTLSKKTDISLRFNKIYGNFMYKDNFYNGIQNVLFFDKNIKYQSTEVDINFKIYKKNFIAPVGKYILFGFGLAKIKSTPKDIRGTLINVYYNPNTNQDIFSERKVDVTNSVNYFKINFGFGNKTILSNNVFLSYGFESNIYLIYNDGISKKDEDYIIQFKKNYNLNLSKNLLLDNLFCIKFGVGIML